MQRFVSTWFPAVCLYLLSCSVQDTEEIQRKFRVKDSERKRSPERSVPNESQMTNKHTSQNSSTIAAEVEAIYKPTNKLMHSISKQRTVV